MRHGIADITGSEARGGLYSDRPGRHRRRAGDAHSSSSLISTGAAREYRRPHESADAPDHTHTDRQRSGLNTYDSQSVLGLDEAQLTYLFDGDTTFSVDTTDLAAGDHEVVAPYSVATGAYGLNSIIENSSGDRNHVVDHLNPSAITTLVNGWIGESDLEGIASSDDVRAAFNDSYEFYTELRRRSSMARTSSRSRCSPCKTTDARA